MQGIGKLPLSLGELGVDSLAVSAHKIHGPKGSGALVLAPGTKLVPLFLGGGQERNLRSGTENVAGIVGLGVACERVTRDVRGSAARLERLRELLGEALEGVHGARLLDAGEHRSPAIAAVLLPGAPAEVWMHHLEAEGVFVSVGSACQAKKREVPVALRALGLGDEEARRVLRISFSHETTEDEVRRAGEALSRVERALGVAR